MTAGVAGVALAARRCHSVALVMLVTVAARPPDPLPHQQWWRDFLRDSAGTGFWHETYFMRGGMEAIYDDMGKPIGMMSFAPLEKARGSMFSARNRLGLGEPQVSAVIPEGELTD